MKGQQKQCLQAAGDTTLSKEYLRVAVAIAIYLLIELWLSYKIEVTSYITAKFLIKQG
jgi:hypothetical protein